MPNLPSADAPLSVILTAGYDRAPQAIALCQLLPRDGVDVAGLVVVTPYSLARVRTVLHRGGMQALRSAVRKASDGRNGPTSAHRGPLAAYFKEYAIQLMPLRELARRYGIPYIRTKSLNDRACVDFVRERLASGVIYCGGGLIREQLISAATNRVLNGHAGPLPEVRGMNAAEWCVLTRHRPCVSIHYIDEGIDTGPVVLRQDFELSPGDDVTALRDRSIAAAIEGLRKGVRFLREPVPPRAPDAAAHRQYFAVAPYLRPLLAARLKELCG